MEKQNKKVKLLIGTDSIIVWDLEKEKVDTVFNITDKSKYYKRMKEILLENNK